MRIFTCRNGFAPVIAVVIIAVLGIVSISTVAASNSSKPGDILYPIDTGVENLRLNLPTSPETEVNLRTKYATERVAEIQALLQEQGIDAPGLDVALANLTDHKTQIESLAAQNKELKNQVKELKAQLQDQSKEVKATYKTAKKDLKDQREDLKKQLAQAIAAGDTTKAGSLKAQIANLELQLDTLGNQEETLEIEDEDEDEVEEAEPEEAPEPDEALEPDEQQETKEVKNERKEED